MSGRLGTISLGRFTTVTSGLILLVAVASGTQMRCARGADPEAWPRWRGPTGQGLVNDAQLPNPWPSEAPKPRWELAVADGWSSPITDGRTVIITERRHDQTNGDVERVVAVDAQTGREIWTRENPVSFDPHSVGRRHGNGPKSTPVIAAGRVFTLGIAGWLQALDLTDGRVVWHHHLPAEFGRLEPLPGGRARVVREEHVLVPVGEGQGAPVPLFGYTGSLLVVDQRLIVPVGGARGGTIMAFDLTTGHEAWRALSENVSYSSPIVTTIAGQKQIVVMTGPRVVGLDPTNGRLLWSEPFQIQYDESIGTPVVADNLVIVSATGRPLTAIRIERIAEDLWRAKIGWENYDADSYLSSNVVRDGHLYGMNDGGEFNCVRLADGKTVWTGGRHGYYCAPVLAGERLLALNERGLLLVLAATNDGYRELGRSQLADGESWTSPAIVGSRCYVRSARSLRCFDFTAERE